MATKGAYVLTYRDLMARLKGDKTFDQEIVELMLEQNPILDDLVITEANDGSSNRTTIRTGLPNATWIAYYEGVQGSKGSTRQIRNTAGTVSTKIEIDARMYDEDPNAKDLLMDEVSSHSSSLMIDMADCLIYGNIKDNPRKFNGLMKFFAEYGAETSTDDRVSSHFVFNGKSKSQASVAALRSILLVGWSQKSIRCFYPKGSSSGGMKKGAFYKTDAADASDPTKTYQVYRQYIDWTLGLDVRDFRYAGRLANIQADEMFEPTGVPNYWEKLRRMTTRVRSDGVRQVFYMDKMTWEAVCVWADRKTAANAVQFGDLSQNIPHKLFGIPVKECDAMNTNEDEVSAAS